MNFSFLIMTLLNLLLIYFNKVYVFFFKFFIKQAKNKNKDHSTCKKKKIIMDVVKMLESKEAIESMNKVIV